MGWNSLADLERTLGRLPDAMASWGRAFAACEALHATTPMSNTIERPWRRAAHNLGTVQSEVGRGDEATASYAKAAELREALVRAHPDVPLYRYICPGPITTAATCCGTPVSWSSAARLWSRLLRCGNGSSSTTPASPVPGRLAWSLTNLGMVLQADRQCLERACRSTSGPCSSRQDLLRDYPNVVEYRNGLATALIGLAMPRAPGGEEGRGDEIPAPPVELWESLPVAQPRTFTASPSSTPSIVV